MKACLSLALLTLGAIAFCQDVTGTWTGTTVKSLPKDATEQEKKLADKVLQMTVNAAPKLILKKGGSGSMLAYGTSVNIHWTLKAGVLSLKMGETPTRVQMKVLSKGKDVWLEDIQSQKRPLVQTTWRRKA